MRNDPLQDQADAAAANDQRADALAAVIAYAAEGILIEYGIPGISHIETNHGVELPHAGSPGTDLPVLVCDDGSVWTLHVEPADPAILARP